jgi:hypothetical protein
MELLYPQKDVAVNSDGVAKDGELSYFGWFLIP